MNDLERRYRAGMRWYTAKWRRNNADALLSTLVDGAEASGRTRPTARELRNLAWTGVRQRAFAMLPWVLFAIAFINVALITSLLGANVGGSAGLVVTLPLTRMDSGVFAAGWAYLANAVVFLACVALGIVTLRRNRSILKR